MASALLLAATCSCLFITAADSQCTGALDTPPDMSGITPSRKVNALKKFVISEKRNGKGSDAEDYSECRIV